VTACAGRDASLDRQHARYLSADPQMALQPWTWSSKRCGQMLVIGMMYGLQPDTVFSVLPAVGFSDLTHSFVYIAMVVFGTMAAAGIYTTVIGKCPLLIIRLCDNDY